MTATLEPTNHFLAQHAGIPGHAREWINALRRRGIERFREVGFPTTRQEAWRDTNVAPIARTAFTAAPAPDAREAAALHGRFSFGREAAAELVFVNGHFSPELSRLDKLPRGLRIAPLAGALETDAALLERHLGRYADVNKNPFAALNTSFLQQGAFVHVARGAAVEKPVHLLFLSRGAGEPIVSHPRTLIVCEENAQLTVVETYAGEGSTYLTNAVTEIVVAPSALIDHCKLHQESREAFHVATQQVHLEHDAKFISHATTLGGKLTRNDLNVFLDGEHAEATLNGLVIINGEQHVDNHTLLQHEKPNCPSHELYKHVLAEKATAVFKGQIYVQKGANGTDAKQTSKSLLLSDQALINSQPALEIYADDVKCTHGSTIGPVDESAVFYLQSRGLSYEASRHLLTYAFAADITRRIRVAPVRARIEDFMAAQHGLPQDLRITEEAQHDVPLM